MCTCNNSIDEKSVDPNICYSWLHCQNSLFDMRNQIRARKQTNGYKENSKLLNNCRETDTCIQNAILKKN